MNNFGMAKNKTASKIEEMLCAVFSSKAAALLLAALAVFCGINIVLSLTVHTAVQQFLNTDLLEYFIDITEQQNAAAEYDVQQLYIGWNILSNFISRIFIVFAAIGLWAFFGTLTVYLRSKNPTPQKSPRAGLTALQALWITKLVIEVFPLLFALLVSFILMTDANVFFMGIISLLFVLCYVMKLISGIIFLSSAKKTLDGINPSSSGAGALQFSAFMIGLVTAITSTITLIALLAPTSFEYDDVPKFVMDSLTALKSYLIWTDVLFIIYAVVHFLIFAVVRHYAVKFPLAVNAQRVYIQNMSNLYPEMAYPENPSVPTSNYNNFQPYNPNQYYNHANSPTPPNGYTPYQNNSSFSTPYPPNNDNADYTKYPPYQGNSSSAPYPTNNNNNADYTKYPPYQGNSSSTPYPPNNNNNADYTPYPPYQKPDDTP